MTREAAQRHRVNRVINFVHANLSGDIDLHRMADVACLSKHHFVRVFDAHLGQTPLRYLNRVRLERAARQLVYMPKTPIGRIAENCGFASHHSFTRAFSRHFDHAPHQSRTLDVKQDKNMPIEAFDGFSEHAVRAEFRPATRIAYIRHFGAYRRNSGGISQAAEQIRDWMEVRGIDKSTPLVGLCPDNRRITPTPFCIYDVGVPVDEKVNEDDVVSMLTIPAGRYAVANIRCQNEQIISAWDWLLSTWLESHATPYEQRWSYEVFHDNDDGKLIPERGMNICLRFSD